MTTTLGVQIAVPISRSLSACEMTYKLYVSIKLLLHLSK